MSTTMKKAKNYGQPDKAKLPTENVMNGQWPDKKEQTAAYQIVAVQNGKFYTPITARLFMGRSASSSVVYASIWCHHHNASYNGHGNAGGYGYHKGSAAMADAIRSAGIELNGSISGVGDTAIEYALSAIARAMGFRKFHLVKL